MALLPQIIATCVACIGAFALGTSIGWSSPSLPDIHSSGALGGNVTTQDEAWIGSLLNLGAMTSSLFVGPAMERLGRKYTILLLQAPMLLGWILIAAAQNVWMVMAGRVLTGFSGGSMTLIVPVYVAEIAEAGVRGTLSSFLTLGIVTGILFSYIVGSVVSWVWLSIINAVVPLLGCCMLFIPDSPRSLLERGKEDDALKALAWLRSADSSSSVESELKEMQKSLSESEQRPVGLADLLAPSVLRPILICMAPMFLQQLGGVNAVIFYSVSIFESAGSDLSPNLSAILIGAVQVAVTVPTVFLIDRLGRKPLFVLSEVGMSLCLAALGVFFYLKEQQGAEGVAELGWLPLVSLIVYIVTYGLGMGPLPWVLLGELCPSHIKGLAGGIANSFCWGLAFVVTRSFSDVVALISPAGCYWLFAGCSMAGAVFAAAVAPETKGKSLDEINALFK